MDTLGEVRGGLGVRKFASRLSDLVEETLKILRPVSDVEADALFLDDALSNSDVFEHTYAAALRDA